MGYFGECIITTLELDKEANENDNRIIAKNESFIFDGPAYFSWQTIMKNIDENYYNQLAEGLFVRTYREPTEHNPKYPINVWPLGKNVFTFTYNYHGLTNKILCHTVLPEYFYLSEEEIYKLRYKNATVYTHNTRQCITLVYNKQDSFILSMTITGPDEEKFNDLLNEPQPIIFNELSEKGWVFSDSKSKL